MTTSVRRVGRYAVEEVVGAGAFATVYRAVDERLGATVAIKVLADNHCLDPEIRARFIDEGRALRRVASPHVVRVYDAGETDRAQPYLVLDYADRGTLAQRVADLRSAGWQPGVSDLRPVVTQLAAAMDAVHAADLVHRDLSPGNVLLRGRSGPAGPGGSRLVAADEALVVADLGLSKDLARSSGLTAAGGTDGFRPPEQRGGPARIDHRADLWALSAVLFWLLTGHPPGDADPKADRRQLERSLETAGLPGDLAAPVLRNLDADPARRHDDVAAWQAAVLDALAEPAAATGAAPPAKPFHQRRAVRRAALVAAGIGLGIAATTAVGAWGDDDPLATRQLDGGRVEVSAESGDDRLTLVGPDEAAVGTTVTFEASARGVDQWVWLMPDGRVTFDTPTAQLRTQSSGTARITLLGLTETGQRLEVVHELRVTDS